LKYTSYCRSVLNTPATAVEWYAKAHRSGADICVVDLEDAIPPQDKADARCLAEGFFTCPSATATRCGIRINPLMQPDGLRDLLTLQEYAVKPAIVVIPKVEAARDIELVDKVLNSDCPDTEYFAIIETPSGLENSSEIARASRKLRGLIFGAADYSLAVGARLGWENLLQVRARILNSARAAGLEAVDTPVFEVSDLEYLRRESRRVRDLGFSGKIAIHPGQIPIINELFSPDTDTLQTARRILAAGQAGGLNIAVVDGAMVGSPFFEASKRLIEEFGSDAVPVASGFSRDLPLTSQMAGAVVSSSGRLGGALTREQSTAHP
jgi:citrate lyase beta subunit